MYQYHAIENTASLCNRVVVYSAVLLYTPNPKMVKCIDFLGYVIPLAWYKMIVQQLSFDILRDFKKSFREQLI